MMHDLYHAPRAGLARLSSDLEDLRTAWRDACDDLRLAHAAWRSAGAEHSAEAFWVVVATADREAAAAEVLRLHVRASA
jgi:hypothetical protein